MSNSFLTVDMVTREALRVAHEQATFVGTVDRSFDESFTGDPKIGATLRIRKPNEFTVRTSGRVMDVQDQSETNATVTVGTQYGVDMRFHSDELALSIDDFSERYISPAIKRLVSKVDSACIETATKATYNCVGTAGTVVGTSGDISAIHNARARLNQMLAPKDGDRFLQMDSVTMATVANGLKGLFLPNGDVSKAFREGLYARTAMADIYENERTLQFTVGSDVTGTTDAAAGVTDGGTTLSADTASPVTYTLNTVFTIAGVYACHPETKQSLGYLAQFTNTAGTGSGGDMTISPPTYLTGAKQNVCSVSSAALATTDFDSKTLVAVGTANATLRQNLMYHKEAFTFVTANLPLMSDSESCVRRQQDGISLRVWKGADIINDRLLMRIDLLWGFAAIRPEWACRITN
jgi:hypothetical protein